MTINRITRQTNKSIRIVPLKWNGIETIRRTRIKFNGNTHKSTILRRFSSLKLYEERMQFKQTDNDPERMGRSCDKEPGVCS